MRQSRRARDVSSARRPLEEGAARSLLDELLAESKLYASTREFQELMDFVVRFRDFSPFNAMLIQIQKPGLRHAASVRDLWQRFERRPRHGARPLLILVPFGPVGLVYDLMDTEGQPLPEVAAAFRARGRITLERIAGFETLLRRSNVEVVRVDYGDNNAGSIEVAHRAQHKDDVSQYRMTVNQNHNSAVQFSTIAHELAHLFLGHLGRDAKLGIPKRGRLDHATEELEAECVAFIVCERNEVDSDSRSYLARFVNENTTVGNLDLYQIMRAAGQVEAALGLATNSSHRRPAVRMETPRLL